jgi:hypothetical protein
VIHRSDIRWFRFQAPDKRRPVLVLARHARRVQEAEERPVIMPLTRSTVAAIDRRTKDDPKFAAAVDAELQAMRIRQQLAPSSTGRRRP